MDVAGRTHGKQRYEIYVTACSGWRVKTQNESWNCIFVYMLLLCVCVCVCICRLYLLFLHNNTSKLVYCLAGPAGFEAVSEVTFCHDNIRAGPSNRILCVCPMFS